MTVSKAHGHFQRILVGFDGSQGSEKAFQIGLSIAKTLDSRLEVLAVIQRGEPASGVGEGDALEHAHRHYDLALSRIMKAANGHSGKIETRVAVGHPAEEIIKRAEQIHSDLIVMGHRGLSNFKNLEMGSVSEHVLAYAPCPVLVTR
jgi:nucleotide-binding universal stress UspA family protein